MSDLFDTDEIDDEIPDFDKPDMPQPARENAAEALALTAMEAALTRRSRDILKRHPSVIIVKVPGKDWVGIIASRIKHMERAPAVRTVTERVKQVFRAAPPGFANLLREYRRP